MSRFIRLWPALAEASGEPSDEDARLNSLAITRLGDLDEDANLTDSFGLGDQLLSAFQLADDLLGRVADTFQRVAPGPARPEEDCHPPHQIAKAASNWWANFPPKMTTI